MEDLNLLNDLRPGLNRISSAQTEEGYATNHFPLKSYVAKHRDYVLNVSHSLSHILLSVFVPVLSYLRSVFHASASSQAKGRSCRRTLLDIFIEAAESGRLSTRISVHIDGRGGITVRL